MNFYPELKLFANLSEDYIKYYVSTTTKKNK